MLIRLYTQKCTDWGEKIGEKNEILKPLSRISVLTMNRKLDCYTSKKEVIVFTVTVEQKSISASNLLRLAKIRMKLISPVVKSCG